MAASNSGASRQNRPLRVLFLASEAFPLAKTGGLGDVAAALPLALHKLGIDVRVMLPGYPSAVEALLDKQTVSLFDEAHVQGHFNQYVHLACGFPHRHFSRLVSFMCKFSPLYKIAKVNMLEIMCVWHCHFV